ncbi:MAG: sulfurtransferase [Magnetovibrio sp.]|nr:sulfurtransferase [Magnetovibrio sp.]
MKTAIKVALTAISICLSTSVFAATPLVDTTWINNNINNSNIVFLDVRGRLAGKSKADYLRGHIPGAVWTNYLKDGWRIKDGNGTVGQLPPAAKLEKLIGSLGISNDKHVVIIPQGGKALDMGTATRVYWTFKVLGHNNVSILDGGMKAYGKVDPKTKKAVNKLEKGDKKATAVLFKANLQKDMVISKSDVAKGMKNGTPLIDNRPNNQYVGVNQHPKAKRLGTIPGAINFPENWMTANGGGKFRPTSDLKKLFKLAGVNSSGDQITFCNSGHWASLGWFVSHELVGNKQSKMYDGSMIEWSADMSLPMEQKIKIN